MTQIHSRSASPGATDKDRGCTQRKMMCLRGTIESRRFPGIAAQLFILFYFCGKHSDFKDKNVISAKSGPC